MLDFLSNGHARRNIPHLPAATTRQRLSIHPNPDAPGRPPHWVGVVSGWQIKATKDDVRQSVFVRRLLLSKARFDRDRVSLENVSGGMCLDAVDRRFSRFWEHRIMMVGFLWMMRRFFFDLGCHI